MPFSHPCPSPSLEIGTIYLLVLFVILLGHQTGTKPSDRMRKMSSMRWEDRKLQYTWHCTGEHWRSLYWKLADVLLLLGAMFNCVLFSDQWPFTLPIVSYFRCISPWLAATADHHRAWLSTSEWGSHDVYWVIGICNGMTSFRCSALVAVLLIRES